MWGESSSNCENNCQCSGLLTDSFKINSGNNASKRKQETAISNNYKLKMNPHSLDFSQSPIQSPVGTQTKRRILGEIQNFKPTSPYIERLKNSPLQEKSPIQSPKSPFKSPLQSFSPFKSPLSVQCNEQKFSPKLSHLSSTSVTGYAVQSSGHFSESIKSPLLNSPIISSINTHSPLTTRVKKSSKISRIFEERTKFKKENKENEGFKFHFEEETRDGFGGRFGESESWSANKPFTAHPITVPEDTQMDDLETLQDLETFDTEFEQCTKYEIISTDSPDIISRGRNNTRKISAKNFNFGAPLAENEQSTSFNRPATRMLTFDEDFDFASPVVKKTHVKKSLKFNEAPTEYTETSFSEYETVKFDETDSETSSKFCETTTKVSSTTKYTNRSLKFTDTPTKYSLDNLDTPSKYKASQLNRETPVKYSLGRQNSQNYKLRPEKSDSSISIGSITSPGSSKSRLYSESTTSMESGFVSEFEEPFLEIEESNSPKIANFDDLLSRKIKTNIIIDKNFTKNDRNFMKRPTLARSLSFHPDRKTVSLKSILESPKGSNATTTSNLSPLTSNLSPVTHLSPLTSNISPLTTSLSQLTSNFERRNNKRVEREEKEEKCNKRRKSENKVVRPTLQRAYSENNASIMSALARSALNPDLIGDFSQPFRLPLSAGDHPDLKSISCDTLADLLRGRYDHLVSSYQIIDCRYPYEFEGGHIQGAINLYTHSHIQEFVEKPSPKKQVLIFHCEFSIQRGPTLSRHLRAQDRALHRELYPRLHYPEVYLLQAGYKAFHSRHAALCTGGYTAMADPRHAAALQGFYMY